MVTTAYEHASWMESNQTIRTTAFFRDLAKSYSSSAEYEPRAGSGTAPSVLA